MRIRPYAGKGMEMRGMVSGEMLARDGEPVNAPDEAKVRRRKRAPRGTSEKELALRKQGICPHSGEHCKNARWCEMSRPASCALLVGAIMPGCSQCRRKSGGKCGWRCFREK